MDIQANTTISIDFEFSPIVNYALQQNHVPLVRKLIVTNTSDIDLKCLNVKITSEPEFSTPWIKHYDVLRAGESQTFSSINVSLFSKFLAELTERLSSQFVLTVVAEDQILFKDSYKVEVLAYDQWNGIGLLPEMLAAFIMPNDPEIPKIIRNASVVLNRWTGSPSFDGYQSQNPDRVKKQIAAIYQAISEMQIVYCSVPASFEERGQRVRLINAICTQKLGNCLDMSLTYTACLEAVGIHPLMIITKGHAFVGAWLIDESFADPVNDDPSLIKKRTADGINDILVVEATCMNAGSNFSFDEAVSSANQKMLITADFQLFIDVKRTRSAGIRPLPIRILTSSGWEIKEDIYNVRDNVIPEDIYVDRKLIHSDKIDVSKQNLWERKLLDLTLRNNLLNIRITKSVVQFLTFNLGKLEDTLAEGKEFMLLPKPKDWENPIRDIGIYQSIHSSDPIADLVKSELSQQRLRTYLAENELVSSLTNIYRSAKVSIEENGANTLFIGLGLLKWYETELSEKPRFAPLILIPVEILHKSAQKGFTIRSREEETIFNVTLLEMLRQDFGISIGVLDPLPKDESGVDVKMILNIVRQSIMAKSRWDVEEQAILGTFSFSKFILWNDIRNNSQKLSQNKVVASLISGKLELPVIESNGTGSVLDVHLHPSAIALPISTDSSQLQAIIDANEGKSFVLHGPPGTGKSQTITNIIANALRSGKKVLFVAAKKAALEVVHKRLEAIGIGDFCLELHSNKSKKSAVLDQLKKATQVTKKANPEDFQATAERLFNIRLELNAYVEALHQKHTFGYSLFDLFTKCIELEAIKTVLRFPASQIATLTSSKIKQWNDLIEEFQTIAVLVPNPRDHPLQAINLSFYTTHLKFEAKELIEKTANLLRNFYDSTDKAASGLGLNNRVIKKQNIELLAILVSQLLNLPDSPSSLFEVESLEQTLTKVISIAKHGKQKDILKATILLHFKHEILPVPAEQMLQEWNIASQKWFFPKWLKHRSISKILKSYSISSDVNAEDVPVLLEKVIAYQEEQKVIDQTIYLPELLGFLWQNGACDWEAIELQCNQVIQINRSVSNLIGFDLVSNWRKNFAQGISEGSKAYIDYHQKMLNEFINLHDEVNYCTDKLANMLGVNFNNMDANVENWIAGRINLCNQWLQDLDSLKDWYSYTAVRKTVVFADLKLVVEMYERGEINHNELFKNYQKSLFQSAAEYIIENNPQLATFNGYLFEGKIKKFRELSASFEQLTKEELYARLSAKIPDFSQEGAQSSEFGMLQKAIRNNGRALAIRKLFDNIPNLLPRLKPCMLMSPISVAQYFEADPAKFDLVIFDEASQMPTCEAVGAIARGRSVIVVGDPKQMPPTNFFSANKIDEDNIEKEDLESILDDCLALSMPSNHLQWHYRSKHESLIAFSNAMYYENSLFTFPSTDDLASKVTRVRVKGFYDKGKTRQNLAEAKAVVEEIVRRLSDNLLRKRSIGVVTFSSAQQALIEDSLDEVFALRPDIEKIAMECEEPIFIKNIENVQGDERDVILFSIGYGPDEQGKVSINFGPINREGGWRRLNVAVSRARYEMKVFSTLASEQIDLNRTKSEGVAGLKAFLSFAEKGKSVLPIVSAKTVINEINFEGQVANEIRKHGYKVDTHIGCSKFKIDIGVVNPKNPSQYILALIGDGKTYFSAKTSSDREIVQQGVLKMLGWNIHKIWSTEWWENPEKVMAEILNAIRMAEEEHLTEPEQIVKTDHPKPPSKENIQESVLQFNSGQMSHELGINKFPYQVAEIQDGSILIGDEFLMHHHIDKIKNQITTVLEIESPISKNLLSKRVLSAWGISRSGSRITSHFEILFKSLTLQKTVSGDKVVFWRDSHSPESYSIYRVAKFELQKRDAEDLPAEEVANCVMEILQNQISLTKIDLIRETAKSFGYARIGTNVENAVAKGIEMAIDRKFAVIDNSRIILADRH